MANLLCCKTNCNVITRWCCLFLSKLLRVLSKSLYNLNRSKWQRKEDITCCSTENKTHNLSPLNFHCHLSDLYFPLSFFTSLLWQVGVALLTTPQQWQGRGMWLITIKRRRLKECSSWWRIHRLWKDWSTVMLSNRKLVYKYWDQVICDMTFLLPTFSNKRWSLSVSFLV